MHTCLVLESGDTTHVGIMLDGRLVEVQLSHEDAVAEGEHPRLVIRVGGEDHHHVALKFDDHVIWRAST